MQVRPGGDIAAIAGICKHLIDADDDSRRRGRARVLDADFIAHHTHGFDEFAGAMRALSWPDVEASPASSEPTWSKPRPLTPVPTP